MSIWKRTKLLFPLVIALVMLAAFALPAPAYAEEGEDTPAEEPVNRIPENGHEPQAPQEEVVIIHAEEPVEPVEEAPASEETPAVEAPAADAPQEEAPAETGTPEPVVSAQESGEGQVSAQYNASLLNNVYFYNAANVAQWYTDINGAVAGFVDAGGKGMIYASKLEIGTYSDALVIGPTLNLTGIVFLDYDSKEAAKYGAAAAFDLYNSDNWAQITNTVTINDMPNFTLAGFKIAVDDANPAVKIDNDNGATGTLTLSYLDISNTAGTGLNIADQTGTIIITAVKSTSTGGTGATLGSDNAIKGKINITNSGFNKSGARGLEIHSAGLVTLNGVSASNNVNGEGLFLDGSGAVVKNSVFSNNGLHGFNYQSRGAGDLTVENSQFNHNANTGLFAGDFDFDSDFDFVRGNITLKNVRADNNGKTGVNLDACGWNGEGCQNISAGNVTISNSNFEKNGQITEGLGLYVLAKGNITLTSVWVGENGDDATHTGGAYLENIHSPTKSSVSVTDCGFSYNSKTGLFVYSLGMITLKDTSAAGNQNAEAGAYLDNSSGTAGINLLNSPGISNSFDNNNVINADTDAGLIIKTSGAVVMKQTSANNNSNGSGAMITARGNVTITNGDFSVNSVHGLKVISMGAITATLTDFNLNSNGSCGLLLENTYSGSSTPKAITLDGGNYYNNGSDGIYILSYGAVTVKNVQVGDSQNNSSGIHIDNSGSLTNASVTITATRSGWNNRINNNTKNGLEIYSTGSITVNKTNAEGNGEAGAYLNNSYDNKTGSVIITNSYFNGNCNDSDDSLSSLHILSNGSVSLNAVQANNNNELTSGTYAVYIDNGIANLGPKPVSIINSEFNNNQTNGLYVNSHGAITITSVYVENNGGGAMIDNSNAATPRAVTVKTSEFSNNGGQGLNILSKGAVTVMDTNAHNNTNGDGLVIDNRGIDTNSDGVKDNGVGDVKVSCTKDTCNFENNEAHGVSVDSFGNITLSRVKAQNNFAGATLVNNGVSDTAPKTVTISDCFFNINNDATRWGLKVQSKGAISLKNVIAGDNAGFGVSLDNSFSKTNAGVTVTGNSKSWAWFGGNDSYGMFIHSLGKVVVSNVNSSDNSRYGLVVDNDDSAKGSVTISNAEFSRNIKDDYTATLYFSLNVTSQGVITLTNVYANENGDNDDNVNDSDGLMPVHGGAYLDNSDSSLTVKPGISLINVSFSRNYGNSTRIGGGLDVYSRGTITIKNIEANENSGNGAYLYNKFAGSTGTIIILRTGVYSNGFNRNGDTGLYAQSNAAITIGNVIADDNGDQDSDFGVYLSNNSANDDIASLITIKDSSIYNSGNNEAGTGSGGLGIFAEGAVLVSNVVSIGNVSDGIHINNSYMANQNITLTRVNTSNNQDQGLEIEATSGNVIISNFSTYANSQQGAYIYTNSSNTSFGSVTFSGNNVANKNGGTGLEIVVNNYGNISLTGVTAEKNGRGIMVENQGANAGTVTLNKVNVNYNQSDGLGVDSGGSVTLNTVYALNNGGSGVSMGQPSNPGTETFTITNCILQGNAGNGLNVDLYSAPDYISTSKVVLTNTIYTGNDVDGSGQLDVYIH